MGTMNVYENITLHITQQHRFLVTEHQAVGITAAEAIY